MNKLKLGAKIGGGFGLLIRIAMILGGIAIINMMSAEAGASDGRRVHARAAVRQRHGA